MTGNTKKAQWRVGICRVMFWVTLLSAIFHLAEFFYVGVRTGSFAFEWALWSSLFYAAMSAALAKYFRNGIRDAADERPREPA